MSRILGNMLAISSTAWLAGVAITAFLLFYLKRSWIRKMWLLSKIPGPFPLPILGNMLLFLDIEGVVDQIKAMHKKYKWYCRVWFSFHPIVVIQHPDDVRDLLTSNIHMDKSLMYNTMHPFLGDGLLTSPGDKWNSHRKLINPTMSYNILENYMPVFVSKSNALVQKLKEKANGETFDICPYTNIAALDIICETAMGITAENQDADKIKFLKAFHDQEVIAWYRILRPWYVLDWTFNFSSKKKEMLKSLVVLKDFTNKVIHDRRLLNRKRKELKLLSNNNEPEDGDTGIKDKFCFLDLLIEASEQNPGWTDKDLRDEVSTFMLGGQSTTATAINFCLFLLGVHQDIQDKVMEELDSIFEDENTPITVEHLRDMKYLEMCIKESLRMYPSIYMIGRHIKADMQLRDYLVPAGCDIVLLPFMVHRNEEVFPQPEKFDPDNFLPENTRDRHPYAYIPFSAGRRNCIGQKFAYMEEKVIISTVLRNFKITSVDKPEDLKLQPNLVLMSKHGIRVKLTERQRRRRESCTT